jgi:hypothetical protein
METVEETKSALGVVGWVHRFAADTFCRLTSLRIAC